jgi:hypothetical protein
MAGNIGAWIRWHSKTRDWEVGAEVCRYGFRLDRGAIIIKSFRKTWEEYLEYGMMRENELERSGEM